MSEIQFQPIKLDPWLASSLLQKAIRRGEAELARRALLALQRHRGAGVWRRLSSIALEDVGIADPDLVWKAVRLATDEETKANRSQSVLLQLTEQLALSPKDRSADYVFCSATKLEAAIEDRHHFDTIEMVERLRIATADLEPITRRAVAALSACCVARGKNTIVDVARATQFTEAFPHVPEPIQRSMLALTGGNSHVFGPMLVVLWSQYSFVGGAESYSRPLLPRAEYVADLPLYMFDKHTAAGKRAIGQLVKSCEPLKECFEELVPQRHWQRVAEMAAFYADAAPVSYRLKWAFSDLLWYSGFVADMNGCGCPIEAALPVLECVRDNLAQLNQLRRSGLVQSPRTH